MKSCVVIGGGINGLCVAYYLALEGHQVTVLDQSDMTDGCSYGNAGLVVPSHVIPLAQPGMIAQGFRWMLDSKSPFYVKPRFHKELFSWAWKFYRHSTRSHVERSMPLLRDLSLFSKELYRDLATKADFLYQEKGLLMLYQSEKVGNEEIEAGREAEQLGLEVNYLSAAQIADLESGVELNARGGVLYKSDGHLYPQKLMSFLKSELGTLGVKILKQSRVHDFKRRGSRIESVMVGDQEVRGDEFILCAGSWSPRLAKKLGIKLSILPGKGYSFDVQNNNHMPQVPAILCEGKVAVTPMGETIRFGGTMEITHVNDNKINSNRVEGILNTINDFYPELNIFSPKKEDTWHGFRPCTPTGLPIISRSKKVSNLVVATGHSMMGLSLGPVTGKLVEEMISGKSLSISSELLQGE